MLLQWFRSQMFVCNIRPIFSVVLTKKQKQNMLQVLKITGTQKCGFTGRVARCDRVPCHQHLWINEMWATGTHRECILETFRWQCYNNGATATYNSSRCRCDSTIVTGQWGLGGVTRQEVSLPQPLRSPGRGAELRWSEEGESWRWAALRTPVAGGFALLGEGGDPRRREREGERRKPAPPTSGWLQGREKRRACRPVTSRVYTASGRGERGREREAKSVLGMHDSKHEESRGGGEGEMLASESRCN